MDSIFERLRCSQGFVLTTAFGMGCFATLSQVILFREELTILEGNELTLSLLLVWWLSGITFGALIPQKIHAEKWLSYLFPAALLALPLCLCYGVTFIRLSPDLFSLPVEEKPSPAYMLILSLGAVAPIGVSIGFAFPLLAIRLKTAHMRRDLETSDNASQLTGSVFIYESFGSVLAGALLILRVVPYFNPFEIAAFMFGFFFLLFFIQAGPSTWIRSFWGVLLGSLIVAFGFGIPRALDSYTAQQRWDGRHPGYTLTRVLETPYQRLEVGERDEQFTVFGSGAPLFSFPNEYEYAHWAHMALSQSPGAERILLLGASGVDLLKGMAEYHPTSLVCIEIDPGIQEIVQPFLDHDSKAAFHRSVQFETVDPRDYFLESQSKDTLFDLIAVNQPNPSNGVLNRFYTRDFFQLARNILNDDGVFVIAVEGTPNYEFGDIGTFCGTLYWTLKDVFQNVLVIPGTQWWYFASPNRSLIADPDIIAERFPKDEIPNFAPELFSVYYDPGRIEQLQPAFEARKSLPKNTDLQPLCYLYDLILWTKQYGYLRWAPVERLAGMSKELIGVGVAAAFLLFLIPYVGFRIFTSRSMKKAAAPLTALSTAGLGAMGAEIAILLFFQSRVGALYQHIGLFFGVFMLGLAFGSSTGVRFLRKHPAQYPTLLVSVNTAFFFMLITAPLIFHLIASSGFSTMGTGAIEILLLTWIGSIAYFGGLLFPTAVRAMEQTGDSLPSISGWADAADHFGGMLGALITGALLIPLLGLVNTFYIFAGIKALDILILVYWKNDQPR